MTSQIVHELYSKQLPKKNSICSRILLLFTLQLLVRQSATKLLAKAMLFSFFFSIGVGLTIHPR